MKIFFDYKIFYLQKYGGISNYFVNLYEEMLYLNKDIYFISPLYKNIHLKNKSFKNTRGYYTKFLPSKLNSLFDQYNIYKTKKHIKTLSPDIVHETYYSHFNNYNQKTFCTVFDMINEKFPKYFNKNEEITEMKKKTVKRSAHIFCISETTKQDLMYYFNIPEEKITVTLLASTFKNKSKDSDNNKIFEDCLLHVGSRLGYKNFYNFIKAFSISQNLKKNFRIIAYGGETVSNYERNLINQLKMEKNIIFVDDKDYDLRFIYQNVKALIFPSLYEGFGLPLVEAMTLGCPIISSEGGSLKEIGGEGPVYFNPNDIENINFECERFLNSESLIKEKIIKGFEISKKFSWKKCSNQTLKIYETYKD